MDNRPYTPDDSTATRPSAVATHPADETYSNPNSSGFFLARAKRDRKVLIHLIIELTLALIIIAIIAIPKLQAAVNAGQSFDARAAASYVGWVGNGANGAKLAITILPCQHNPCSNETLDLAVQYKPHTAPVHYTLGGELLSDHEIYVSAFTSGGKIYSADIITDHPVLGSITEGRAYVTFKQGTTAATFTLTSATLNQISDYFGA